MKVRSEWLEPTSIKVLSIFFVIFIKRPFLEPRGMRKGMLDPNALCSQPVGRKANQGAL
jgi:hypothetical protein